MKSWPNFNRILIEIERNHGCLWRRDYNQNWVEFRLKSTGILLASIAVDGASEWNFDPHQPQSDWQSISIQSNSASGLSSVFDRNSTSEGWGTRWRRWLRWWMECRTQELYVSFNMVSIRLWGLVSTWKIIHSIFVARCCSDRHYSKSSELIKIVIIVSLA